MPWVGQPKKQCEAVATLPRIYCKGSPRIRLQSIVESELVLFLACVNHFSSRRALSRPIRLESVVTSWDICVDRGMIGTGRYPKRNKDSALDAFRSETRSRKGENQNDSEGMIDWAQFS